MEERFKQKRINLYQDLIKNAIYQDDKIIVLNKPANLASQGGNKVKISLDEVMNYTQTGEQKKFLLTHRLDKDTSGLIIMAKTKAAAKYITKLFEKRKIEKQYLAITSKKPKKPSGIISGPISTKKNTRNIAEKKEVFAETKYQTINCTKNGVALLLLSPITGRKHQLRIQLNEIGCPILGDGKYGGKDAFRDGLNNKMHLHAYKILIENYYGKTLSLTATINPEFQKTMNILNFSSFI